MNREIKFRAWDKKNKYMFELDDKDFFVNNNGMYERKQVEYLGDEYNNVSGKFILMLSTGLKDKNGKDIYCGDIYKWCQPLVEAGKHIRKEHLTVVLDEIPELFFLNNRSENDWGGVEIVGNIHENKNLLE